MKSIDNFWRQTGSTPSVPAAQKHRSLDCLSLMETTSPVHALWDFRQLTELACSFSSMDYKPT
jgi:hypothetical protein